MIVHLQIHINIREECKNSRNSRKRLLAKSSTFNKVIVKIFVLITGYKGKKIYWDTFRKEKNLLTKDTYTDKKGREIHLKCFKGHDGAQNSGNYCQ